MRDLVPVISCAGEPMYPGTGAPGPLELTVLGGRPLRGAVVQLTVGGSHPRRLRAAFVIEQWWLRYGFDARLVGTLADPGSAARVGEVSFSMVVRDNDGAMPTEDELLRGLPILFLATRAAPSTPYRLACVTPGPDVDQGDAVIGEPGVTILY